MMLDELITLDDISLDSPTTYQFIDAFTRRAESQLSELEKLQQALSNIFRLEQLLTRAYEDLNKQFFDFFKNKKLSVTIKSPGYKCCQIIDEFVKKRNHCVEKFSATMSDQITATSRLIGDIAKYSALFSKHRKQRDASLDHYLGLTKKCSGKSLGRAIDEVSSCRLEFRQVTVTLCNLLNKQYFRQEIRSCTVVWLLTGFLGQLTETCGQLFTGQSVYELRNTVQEHVVSCMSVDAESTRKFQGYASELKRKSEVEFCPDPWFVYDSNSQTSSKSRDEEPPVPPPNPNPARSRRGQLYVPVRVGSKKCWRVAHVYTTRDNLMAHFYGEWVDTLLNLICQPRTSFIARDEAESQDNFTDSLELPIASKLDSDFHVEFFDRSVSRPFERSLSLNVPSSPDSIRSDPSSAKGLNTFDFERSESFVFKFLGAIAKKDINRGRSLSDPQRIPYHDSLPLLVTTFRHALLIVKGPLVDSSPFVDRDTFLALAFENTDDLSLLQFTGLLSQAGLKYLESVPEGSPEKELMADNVKHRWGLIKCRT